MSLDRVLSTFGGRILKPTHYEVLLDTQSLNISYLNASDYVPNSGNLTLYAETINFPGRQTLSKQNTTFGALREIGYDAAFSGEITIVFRYTADMPGGAAGIRNMFEQWMNYIARPDSGEVGYYDDYTTNMTINLYPVNDMDNKAIELTINEVYPKSVSDIELGHSLSDIYLKNTVSFAYRHYNYTNYRTNR
jgi:hypothetical protein